ncbi:hypothetical protein [Schaalia suimastitidis]|uniref:hypothetical protein n=1 Tax=Schaalia suimastitidis TaxID=121163 RepID=UPI000415A365|nr:hypothetical protein [Schaalia suimastitidis]
MAGSPAYEMLRAVHNLVYGDVAEESAVRSAIAQLADIDRRLAQFGGASGFVGQVEEAVQRWVSERRVKVQHLQGMLQTMLTRHSVVRSVMEAARDRFSELPSELLTPAEQFLGATVSMVTMPTVSVPVSVWLGYIRDERNQEREHIAQGILDQMNAEIKSLSRLSMNTDDYQRYDFPGNDEGDDVPGGGLRDAGVMGRGVGGAVSPWTPRAVEQVPSFGEGGGSGAADPRAYHFGGGDPSRVAPVPNDRLVPGDRLVRGAPVPSMVPNSNAVGYVPPRVADFHDPRWRSSYHIGDLSSPASGIFQGGIVASGAGLAVARVSTGPGIAGLAISSTTPLKGSSAAGVTPQLVRAAGASQGASGSLLSASAASTSSSVPAGGSGASRGGALMPGVGTSSSTKETDPSRRRVGYHVVRVDDASEGAVVAGDACGSGCAAELTPLGDDERGDRW